MVTRKLRSILLAGASAALVATSATGALAGAFGIREQSVVGGGMAFAGAASGSAGLGSAFWNPATITMAPGWQSEANGTFIGLSTVVRTQAPTPTLGLGQSGDIGISGAIPASYTTYQLTENLW
ncbi:MAG: outer membrane protein transport protein, partial [Methylobacteriaceae bacterium]|nr:outer membrane protein transport protein [Methylobacteriaceae bacterium]